MGPKLNLLFNFLRYRDLIIDELKNNSKKDNVDKSKILGDIDDLFEKVFLDINNAIKSQKKKKIDLDDNDLKNLTLFDYNKEIDLLNNKIKYNEIKKKFFLNLRSIITILRILDLRNNNELSKGDFFNCVLKISNVDNVFYYNISYRLYLMFYVVNIDDNNLLLKIVEDLLNIQVLNICTHFNNDYFKILSFNQKVYERNFSKILMENFKISNRNQELISFINNKDNLKILDLQIQVIEMLNKLLVNFDDQHERKVAHYTTYTVGKLLATNETSLRLNSTDFMNDPTEGKIFQEFLNLSEYEHDSHNKTFLSCFTFNHNSLNQFRLYGLEKEVPCSGLSLVYDGNFFFNFNSIFSDYFMDYKGFSSGGDDFINEGLKIPLFRCIYFDSFTGYFEVAKRNKYTFYQELKDKENGAKFWKIYSKKMELIEKDINKSLKSILKTIKNIQGNNKLTIDQLKSVNKIIKPICFLVKHFSFQEEQECRMIVIDRIDSENVVMDKNDTTRSYVEYGQPTHKNLKNIYIGIASANRMVELLKTIKKKSIVCPKTMVSDNPYRIPDN